jgi:hypothetical protein
MTNSKALEALNKFRNANYNSPNKDEAELAEAINAVFPALVELAEIKERAYKVIGNANKNGYSSEQANYILKGGK